MIILSIPNIKEFPYKSLYELQFDFLELRLDYKPDNKIAYPLLLAKGSKNTILTLRSPEEGGVKDFSPVYKKTLLEYYTNQKNCLADCELDFYLTHRPHIKPENLLISKHFPSHSHESDATVKDRVMKTVKAMSEIEARFYKIVFPVVNYTALEFFFNLPCMMNNKPLILQGTGLLGKLTRLMRLLMHRKGHYIACEEDKTQEEQLTFQDLNNFSGLSLGSDTSFGGIIGDQKVYNSLGIRYYNRLFAHKGLNAVYLPFPAESLPDFLYWLGNLQQRYYFYGFSVTMPHKKNICRVLKCPSPAANLISTLPKPVKHENPKVHTPSQLPFNHPDYLFNTDKDAMKRAFEYLRITSTDKILIFGYGATAEIALYVSIHHPQVFIGGRDEWKGSITAAKFKRRFLKTPFLEKTTFDLLINCSPLGSNKEDTLQALGKIDFDKVIDLPYCEAYTPLTGYCLAENIPHVDGKLFWEMQAAAQEEIFTANIKRK